MPGIPSVLRPLLLVALFATATTALGEGLTREERDALWRDARQQLQRHPRLVFHNGATALPDYPAFPVSNESAYWTMQPPAGPPGMQVGFGNIINFNLLVARGNRTMVVTDQSEETLVTMMSFWRPMFLVADSPAAFVANAAGLELRPGETLNDVFRRIANGERGTEANLARIGERLQTLVTQGKITAFDRRFALAVIYDQINPPPEEGSRLPRRFLGLFSAQVERVPVFRNARGGTAIPQGLAHLYWADNQIEGTRARVAQMEEMRRQMGGLADFLFQLPRAPIDIEAVVADMRRRMTATSFLEPAGFAHVREVLAAGGDHYAQAEVRDPAFWRAVAAMATNGGHRVTDVYFSNILPLMFESDPAIYLRLRPLLVALAGERQIAIYEAAIDAGQGMRTSQLGLGSVRPWHGAFVAAVDAALDVEELRAILPNPSCAQALTMFH